MKRSWKSHIFMYEGRWYVDGISMNAFFWCMKMNAKIAKRLKEERNKV